MNIEDIRNISIMVGFLSAGFGCGLSLLTWFLLKSWNPKSTNLAGLKMSLWPWVVFMCLIGSAIVGKTFRAIYSIETGNSTSSDILGRIVGSIFLYVLLFVPLFFLGRYNYRRKTQLL